MKVSDLHKSQSSISPGSDLDGFVWRVGISLLFEGRNPVSVLAVI